ncbi:MAG: energy-coupled thiamine transporter ThiT [Oscillospiraceae bacterium]|jgi:thiamine transporter|nr:energy-coupled thiamine transporter ThiT [Oscillospiraceae bacterium]
MQRPENMSEIKVLTECAVLAALSFALSAIPTPMQMPLGGTVSWFSTVPVLIAALRHGFIWGTGTAMVHGMVQLLMGFDNVTYAYAAGFAAAVGCALLDYVLAYTALGVAGLIFARSKRGVDGCVSAVLISGALRLLCSFLSGVLIWSSYTPEGWNVTAYSLAYNAAWCVPDVAIALAGVLALQKVIPYRARHAE